MPPVGFEPAVSVGERPQTYGLDGVATGTGEMTVRLLYTNPTYAYTLHTQQEISIPTACFGNYIIIMKYITLSYLKHVKT